MPNFYPYLISSLPMLHFGMRPPFSFEGLLMKCEELIPPRDLRVLKGLALQDTPSAGNATIKRWRDFDTVLRNELVNLRAVRRKKEAAKYLRPDGYAGPSLYHIALAAQRSASPLEAERILDRERWNILEELSCGHYFDLDFLIVYGYKLLILERWEGIDRADKDKLLNEALAKH